MAWNSIINGCLLYIMSFSLVSVKATADFVQDFSSIVDFINNEVNRERIALHLKILTQQPHVGGTLAERETARYVAKFWEKQGLDEVHMTPYDVLLSYPSIDNPSYVRIHNSADTPIWISEGRTKPLHSEEEWSHDVFPNFNAYSPPGNIKGDVVFINFATEQDFKKLNELGVNITGCIVIAKYGTRFRANIVRAAEERGAIGVILYTDPQQFANDSCGKVYPDDVFLPGSGVQYGTVNSGNGDPLTPYYPSIESAFRIPEEASSLPKIPVLPIGYDDAYAILSKLGGAEAPTDWQGRLNFTYRLGPDLQDDAAYVSMEVNTHNQMSKTYNVIGMIRGSIEPDRYVILGNHRDAWIFGAIDPSSATAAMLELTRVLAEYRRRTGWSPRRSLLFCSWGSEEYGLVGSTEWTEQFGKQLADRAIAYLNVDMAIEGNYTLRTQASPLLHSVTREMSKLVPNPDPEEVKAGRTTVYDTWVLRKPDETKPGLPRITSLGSGSDYSGFQNILGIPSLDLLYTSSEPVITEPLYHTLYETFYLVSDLYDKGFHFHAALTQLWATLGTYMADVKILPFSLDEYAEFISAAQTSFYQEYGALIEARNISFEYFRNASEHFTRTVNHFEYMINSSDLSNDLTLRRINDQIMMVERAFIDPRGLPGRPDYNHVVVAPSLSDGYASVAFAGLSDALLGISELSTEEQERRWRIFEKHLATCTHLLLTASKVLSDDLWYRDFHFFYLALLGHSKGPMFAHKYNYDLGGLSVDVIKTGTFALKELKHLILIIPGNPGLVEYYTTFAEALYKKLDGFADVWALSHSCHAVSERHQQGPMKCNKLDLEIEHKLRFLEQKVPPNCQITLVGHSIGCYMILSVLEMLSGMRNRTSFAHLEGSLSQSNKTRIFPRINKCIFLFPTIERMKVTSNGKRLWPILNYLQWFTVGLITLISWLPLFLRTKIATIVLGKTCQDPTMVQPTLDLLTPRMFENMLNLAFDELTCVNSLPTESIMKFNQKLIFYFGKSDGWCPLSYKYELENTVPNAQTLLDDEGAHHAFVLLHSLKIAKVVSNLIRPPSA